MTVGEFFINLGVKGADKAMGALGSVKNLLSEGSSNALILKGSIIGAFYALERLMEKSAATGMALHQFGVYTGESADKLQRWQYLGRQSGIAAEEMQSSIQGVQDAMQEMVISGRAPEGLGTLAAKTGGFDVNRAYKDVFYVMDKLRQFAKETKDTPGLANKVLKSFSLSPGVVTALRESKVELDKIRPSELYTDSEVNRLKNINVGWSNLFNFIEKSIGKMNAMEGEKILQGVTKVTEQVLKLVQALVTLADKLKVFEAISRGFEVISNSIEKMNEGMGVANASIPNRPYDESNWSKGTRSLLHFLLGAPPTPTVLNPAAGFGYGAGQMIGGAYGGKTTNNNTSNTVNVNVHSNGSPEENGKAVAREVNKALRQLPVGRVN